MKCVNELNKSYIAGFVDGECSIGLYGSGNTRTTIRASICIYNTNIKVLNWINSLYGGWLCKRPMLPRHRQCYCLYIGSKEKCLKFLTDIYPYLRIKQKQAKLVIEFCKTPSNRSISKKDKKMLIKSHSLNERGERHQMP